MKMKKILLDSNKNYYKANLHSHSTKSDGAMTVEEMKEYYMERGYSVIAYTDHEHLIDNSYLNDENFLAITSCELDIKEDQNFSTSVKREMKVCHLNLLAKDPKNIKTPCYSYFMDKYITDEIRDQVYQPEEDFQRVYSTEKISEMIKTANEQGFLVTYNHPRWSLENATIYLGYKDIWAVEIYNHSSEVGGIYEYDINAYDDFLRDGQRCACVCADDNHSAASSCGGYVMINADKLDYDTIMKALENHDFYASTGPVIKELYIEDDTAYLTYEGGIYATISTRGRRAQRIVAENPDGVNTVAFKFLPDDGYIRFDVVGKDGTRANTNAYFLDEI